MGAKPPILEFLRKVRRTSDFGVLNIINNIFKTTQNLRFWSFCGRRILEVLLIIFLKPPILEFLRNVRRTSDFGVLNIINNILKLRKTSDFGVFAVGAKPPILEFLRKVRRTSDFGVLNIINNIFKTTQNLRSQGLPGWASR